MATSSSAVANHSYEVFINHRGPEVKKTFASYLYRRLLSYRLRVFLDQHELQVGDNLTSQIEGAIRNASVHVTIFSPRYAESVWCLNELVLILETGATIIPVFYGVKPSELKWTKGRNGLYAQALHKLEEKKTHEEKPRYDSATIENWSTALSRVAEISGFELKACNGDEGELLEKVVECVLKKVKIAKRPTRLNAAKYPTRLNVAKYPTGLDEKVKDFENRVLMKQQESGKPPILGIVGLAGVGKTTLAKELFNRKSLYYRKSCFISDVRENADKASLTFLQRKLLQSLTGSDPLIDSVDEGIETIKEYLSSSHAFIVLDDVDQVDQVDALLPNHSFLRSDSLVLITSRDRHVLTSSGVEESAIYKLTRLNTQHSRELFCFHTFGQPHPFEGSESLVDKYLDACDGLPLSLKVFGALLRGNYDTSFWEDQLDSLQQILPIDIERKLKISYDALNIEEQQIFLDIACFFIGENRDMAIRIWEGSGWKGLLRFQNLENKCLVEVDSENNIHMHHHLRNLGRGIADASTLPRRFWRKTQNIDALLQQSSIISEVRGIRMVPSADSYVCTFAHARSQIRWYERSHELFWNRMKKLRDTLYNTSYLGRNGMMKLQILITEDGLLEPILRRVHSPNLIWFRWYKCPYYSLPNWVSIKNLRVLEVRGAILETLWQGESQAPLHLRVLEISAPLLKIPKSIGKLKHLERICLQNLEILTLPKEFCYLWSLKTMILINCSKMRSLPDSFGNLTNLQRIDLHGFHNLERLPDSFGNLIELECIHLHGSHNLERLPDSFGNLIRLKYLDLQACSNLKISSETLENIRRIEYINLSACPNIEVLPPQVAKQQSLEKLYLWATNLTELPSDIGNLRDLAHLALESALLTVLPASLGYLTKLKELTLWDCTGLEVLPESLGLLSELTELTVVGCPLRELSVIKVQQNSGETSVETRGLCCLPKLQILKISRCKEVEELPNIESLVSLEVLRASECVKLKSIRGLEKLTKLQELDVANCLQLEELPGVENCMSLERFDASRCSRLLWREGVVQTLRQRLKEGFVY